MKKSIAFLSVFALCFSLAPSASAGECFSHQVEVYSGTGTINSGVNLRNKACMEGSSVVGTLSGGTSVKVLAHNDGWYQVSANGVTGWLWGSFVSVNASPTGVVKSYWDYDAMHAGERTEVTKTETEKTEYEKTEYRSAAAAKVYDRVKGHILLQVEKHGEAWYVDPVTAKRYYMKDGPTAYQMMRSFGLGVTEKDYASMEAGSYTLKNKLRGRIVLRVHKLGEAYYIHPETLKMHYLQNGDEAYRVMRLYSLGISNTDLDKLESKTIPVK